MNLFSGNMVCIDALTEYGDEWSPCKIHWSNYGRVKQNTLNKLLIWSLEMSGGKILLGSKYKGREAGI